ncbi:BtpA/SgcQ family protein [Halomicrobium salinisoli]|uniref:BtpA/SgcQ family protein n=1 Tax=Halomicrobium salinisoli TaxID=2878391 RepID=UPI001CF0246E|nr:BtpA/SgcQ family protein [Halomicrobium salinisoli]
MDVEARLGAGSPVVGMVHLPPLPGAPEYEDREGIRERAVADAEALVAGGADAVLVENFGDAPFYPEDVPDHVVAEMTAAARAVCEAVDCPVGVNVLRNDAEAALSVAAAAGGSFVRVNVHVGARATDQGVLEGRAHETLRLRERIDADVAVLADVAVKHSAPLSERPLAEQVADAVERGRADGLVVSGPATGEATDADELAAAVDARNDVDPDVPVLVGSGVTAENAPDLLDVADGAIVGTAFKRDGDVSAPVDEDRVRRLVAAVRDDRSDTGTGI